MKTILRKEVNSLFNRDKFAELILYIAQATMGDADFGKTKMAKALWLSDFKAFRRLGMPITGATYQNRPFGPAAKQYIPVLQELLVTRQAGEAEQMIGLRESKRVVAMRPVKFEMFSAEEIAIVDGVLALIRDLTAKQLSDLSHEWMGYKLTESGEDIPYGICLVPEEPLPLSEADMMFGKSVAAKIQSGEYSCSLAAK